MRTETQRKFYCTVIFHGNCVRKCNPTPLQLFMIRHLLWNYWLNLWSYFRKEKHIDNEGLRAYEMNQPSATHLHYNRLTTNIRMYMEQRQQKVRTAIYPNSSSSIHLTCNTFSSAVSTLSWPIHWHHDTCQLRERILPNVLVSTVGSLPIKSAGVLKLI